MNCSWQGRKKSEDRDGASVVAIECWTHRTIWLAQGNVTVEYILPSILLTVYRLIKFKIKLRINFTRVFKVSQIENTCEMNG